LAVAKIVGTMEFKALREKITADVERKVQTICLTENPVTEEGRTKILKAQGELAGMRLVFAMFSQLEKDEDNAS
jgi:hypothetical protein